MTERHRQRRQEEAAQRRRARKSASRTSFKVLALCIALLGFYQGYRGLYQRQANGDAALAPPESGQAEAPETGSAASGDDWQLFLVSPARPLPRDFTVDLQPVQGAYRMDVRAAPAAQRMIADAAAEGVTLTVCSAYRGIKLQTRLYEQKVEAFASQGLSREEAQDRAKRVVEPPGESEHHTGLAVDFITPEHTGLDEGFAQTAAYRWLQENAARYGFVERYPAGLADVTGVDWEPWHYRYVGTAHASHMAAEGLCLEQYVEEVLKDESGGGTQ